MQNLDSCIDNLRANTIALDQGNRDFVYIDSFVEIVVITKTPMN